MRKEVRVRVSVLSVSVSVSVIVSVNVSLSVIVSLLAAVGSESFHSPIDCPLQHLHLALKML